MGSQGWHAIDLVSGGGSARRREIRQRLVRKTRGFKGMQGAMLCALSAAVLGILLAAPASAASAKGDSAADFGLACAALKAAEQAGRVAVNMSKRIAQLEAAAGEGTHLGVHTDLACDGKCNATTVASTLASRIADLGKMSIHGNKDGTKAIDWTTKDTAASGLKALFTTLTGSSNSNTLDAAGNDGALALTLIALCNNAAGGDSNICRAHSSGDGTDCPCTPSQVAASALKALLPAGDQKEDTWTQLKDSSGADMSAGGTGAATITGLLTNWKISHLICEKLYPPAPTRTNSRTVQEAANALQAKIRPDKAASPTKLKCLGHLTSSNGCSWTQANSEGACICYDTATQTKQEPAYLTRLKELADTLANLESLEQRTRDTTHTALTALAVQRQLAKHATKRATTTHAATDEGAQHAQQEGDQDTSTEEDSRQQQGDTTNANSTQRETRTASANRKNQEGTGTAASSEKSSAKLAHASLALAFCAAMLQQQPAA
ncbi:hypothetical protein, conserved in T. vivax [Trypanosoma vivax Y486]|uniref:Uncharacterized protein n=1 Tax=Trypanosoma vivax (strain Y486) TaxID=1055687 RepID=F9WL94_TRYVY|nr:hypothetical protein, conserved in T. vivax [Trypanosoma vivax Y486]|eukprot:CCD18282.1 hypothetical protein, conserved in T. vivax [Trypanosoma vivax Y486]